MNVAPQTGGCMRFPIVELRQYALHPGQRDVLIDLFDREFVETQEAEGMAIIGQFRDLDDLDRFVWVRGFPDMQTRPAALQRFYTSPAWRANSAAANATMVSVDNVLLLRPISETFDLPVDGPRPALGATGASPSTLLVTLYLRQEPVDDAFVDFFVHTMRPALAATGSAPFAALRTEYAENNFPALPVRTGEHVFATFARYPDPAALADHQARLAQDESWRTVVEPHLAATLRGAPEPHRLAPTDRSRLR
jgi:quinol monooxygenase YgiN